METGSGMVRQAPERTGQTCNNRPINSPSGAEKIDNGRFKWVWLRSMGGICPFCKRNPSDTKEECRELHIDETGMPIPWQTK
jgi:hypothetical protein